VKYYFVTAGSIILFFAGIVPLCGNEWALTGITPGGHRGRVTAVTCSGNTVISAGEDGFLELWDSADGVVVGGIAKERFQISPYSIIAMVHRPGGDEVCVVENDGMGLYRVSAWNYRKRQNIFTLKFRDPIGYINYSMGGNFIIAARTGRTGLILIDSSSGDILRSPQSLTGIISLAVTGKSERNLMIYLASGAISYWNLETETETNRFNAPSNLYSPVFFSNSRYLAGVNARGLSVVDAASVNVLGTDNAIPNSALLCPAGDDFLCLVQKDGTAELYRYAVDRFGALTVTGHFTVSQSDDKNDHITAIAEGSVADGSVADGAADDGLAVIFGTAGGSLVFAARNGQIRTSAAGEHTLITEAAVSGQGIAFLTESGVVGFIPADFNRLFSNQTISIEQSEETYNRIAAFESEEEDGDGQFIFWNDRSARAVPVIRSFGTDRESEILKLSGINFRSPVSSVSSFGSKILFLDSAGNLTVSSHGNGEKDKPFTFFSMGLMDAAFINGEQLLLARSAVSGNTPFMTLNIKTGETVPLPYPSRAGVAVYRGTSGVIYAAAISLQSEEDSGITTSILQLDIANSSSSIRLADYQGEDTQFSLAESPGGIAGSVAATVGGEGAAIYSASGVQNLERAAGLPRRLIDSGRYLISLDMDGNILWHDGGGEKLLAVFKLRPSGWVLQAEQRIVSGGF
jgi:WD40 repeat protein